ncbi:MAG: hypothetical protein KKA62_02390 [Nanoarchaeota archaeon]|nr:hypothetical protein [Nanoarchaeota archaeon]MBU1643681.1 hypothetical protein [Nanoarchaeota archaeon]MBU1976779.1 hypothetical protein [Nanoarchaeota archaeon]
MIKIIVFNTLEEAKGIIEQNFYKNAYAAKSIMTEKDAREIVYRNSRDYMLRHGNKDGEQLTLEELLRIYPGCGLGEELIASINLYSVDNLHAFSKTLLNPDNFSIFGPYQTIPLLVDGVKTKIDTENKIYFGAKVTPFFYTLEEEFRFSQKVQDEVEQYLKTNTQDNSFLDLVKERLKTYVEKRLTPDEINKFQREYFKFLN